MAAAKAGRSTLGIPQSVGTEFVHETPPAKRSQFQKSRKKKYRDLARKVLGSEMSQ